MSEDLDLLCINTLNAELNPIRHLLALVGARHVVHVSRIRVMNFSIFLPVVGRSEGTFSVDQFCNFYI